MSNHDYTTYTDAMKSGEAFSKTAYQRDEKN